MLRLSVIALCLLATVLAEDSFVKKFGYYNVMRNCFGDDMYLSFSKDVAKAMKVCRGMPVNINMDADMATAEEFMGVLRNSYSIDEGSGEVSSEEKEEDAPSEGSSEEEEEEEDAPSEGSSEEEEEEDALSEGEMTSEVSMAESWNADPWKAIMDLFRGNAPDGEGPIIFPVPFLYLPQQRRQYQIFRRKREALYDSEFLKSIITKVKTKISNFTCTLQQLGGIDENYNINIDVLTKEEFYVNVDNQLKEDLKKGRKQCYELTKCLPGSPMSSPMPKTLERLLAFVKCEKMARLGACMKHDLKKHLDAFDVTAIPKLSEASEDKQAEIILHVLWGSESTDFEVY